ncbi:beta-glucosidase [Aspergillus novoparasiticus]|uniref:Beta-glucosidase n=1 Tax=Aspergillus novoparasiticus TaxID=986946 RepID=A0A5N6EJ77_9EURO|nr:beta-glucosidase [Aspergillus novoparasiticus]
MASLLVLLVTLFECVAGFTYSAVGTERYAKPIQTPAAAAKKNFGPAYAQASKLLPTKAIHTTFTFAPSSTWTDDGPYGQSAFNALWVSANLTYSSTMPFSTTVSPTPIPSSELVFPPPLPIPSPSGGTPLPKDFIWGVAGSAWQIEGAIQAEGRGPAPIVDKLGALPNSDHTDDGVTNSMSYYLYKQDIARLAAIGVPYYSFSISWSRVLPFGVADSPVNQQAIEHYDDVINTCLKYGVTPIVTLWHFDTPLMVDFDEDSMIEDFIYFAQVVMAHFADRVPIWQTFNEPNIGFLYSFREYQTINRITLAHAEVYHWYKDVLNGMGRVSFKFANNLAYPLHGPSNASDVAASVRYQNMVLGMMGNPIFLGQQIPKEYLETAGMNVTALTTEQIQRIRGTADFLSIDPYTVQLATAPTNGIDACAANSRDENWPFCVVFSNTRTDGWIVGAAANNFIRIAPEYVRQQLKYLWDVYKPTGGIMITEFGFPVPNENLKALSEQRFDLERSLYFHDFLTETAKAIRDDGVNVIGSLAWSFVDNNEWGDYSQQYGLQTANRTTFERTFKRSFFDFVDFFHRNIRKGS